MQINMEFIVENLWYIDNKLGHEVYHDAKQRMYVVPKEAVPYSKVFAELDTFNKFYAYAHKKRDETGDQGPTLTLTYIYIKLCFLNTPLKEFLKGYREARLLAASGRTSYVLEKMAEVTAKPNCIKDGDIDMLFLESNEYLAHLKPAQFYKMECNLAKYFLLTRQLKLAYRFAKEALEIASRSASAAGIDESRTLLLEIETALLDGKS